MFNTTHTFVGLAIARTGVDERLRNAAWTAVIAANLPDIEVLTGLSGTPTYLDYHRGITHSLIGIPILSLLVAGGVFILSGHFWRNFLVAFIAMATHPILDYSNTYGWRPFLPFDGAWYYGDLLFIFDPYIDVIFVAGIVGGNLLSNKKVMAWASLIAVIIYMGARFELHEMAVSQVETFAARTPGAEKWAAFPTMLNPFEWEGIIQTKTELIKVRVDAQDGVSGEIARVDRGGSSQITDEAAKAVTAASLLRFARFPANKVEGMRFGAIGYRVLFFDFRFYDEIDKTGLGAEVILDQSFHVLKENLSFAQTIK
jgi:inner membrane protein